MPQVTIAAINGACAGAGLGWACACDLRYAVADAKLNTAFLDVAVAGDMGLPWSLPRLVGAGRARELSLLPRKLTGAEAAEIGLVNDVFGDVDQLRAGVAERAQRLAEAAPLARRAMKAHYVAAATMTFAELVAVETEAHLRITQSDDCREAFRAFVEKRPPQFTGR
jgi:2-(1,2-epoxy-1,2-dihydrophenyl)acetyl-CoA isomerase